MLDFKQGKWRGYGVLYCHREEKWGEHSLAYAIHNKGVLYSIKFCFRHTILGDLLRHGIRVLFLGHKTIRTSPVRDPLL